MAKNVHENSSNGRQGQHIFRDTSSSKARCSGPAPQVNNDDAKAFYQKFGFSVGEVMKDYYKHQQRGATPGPASPRHRPMHPPGGSMGLGLLPRIPEHRHGISEARRGLSSSPQACAQAHDPLHFPPHRRIEPPDAVVLSKKLK